MSALVVPRNRYQLVFYSPFKRPDERRMHMPLAGYYDGSKKAHANQTVLTLAGFAASEETWKEFEAAWEQTLERHQIPFQDGVRCFHTGYAMRLTREFSRRYGWNEARVSAAVEDLLATISLFRDRDHFVCASCSVDLHAHERAKAKIEKLRSPEAMCVDFCVGGLGTLPEDAGKPDCILLYFDRDEPFLKRANAIWQRYKKRRQGWAVQVASIAPVDRRVYEIQAADMVAWFVSTHYTQDSHEAYWRSIQWIARNAHAWFDYDKIIATYPNG